MKIQSSKIKTVATFLLFIIAFIFFNHSTSFGQQGSWEFGSGTKMFVDQYSKPLKVRVSNRSDLTNYAVVGGVGGIAFQETAINKFNCRNVEV